MAPGKTRAIGIFANSACVVSLTLRKSESPLWAVSGHSGAGKPPDGRICGLGLVSQCPLSANSGPSSPGFCPAKDGLFAIRRCIQQ